MKTNKLILAVLAAIMLITLGCATRQHVTLKNGDQEIYSSSHVGIFPGPDNALSAATAYSIKKQADTYEKMMADLQGGKMVAATGGKFLIGIINNSSSRAVYLFHPEIPGMKLTAYPNGGFQVFEVRDMPYEIAVYEMNGKLAKQINPRYEPDYQEKLAHKKLVGNMLVDFVIKVNGTY